MPGISEERCAANRAAGRINFATGFFFVGAAGIANVVAANELGYFEEFCLDVRIVPGTGGQNLPRLASGDIQITTRTSASQAAIDIAAGVQILVIGIYGRFPIWTLGADPDITDLTQLVGEVVGIKFSMPPEIEAMFAAAGVAKDDLKLLLVGFDPRIIAQDDIRAIPFFKSNEPGQLDRAGIPANYFNPEDFGVEGSFGTMVARSDFTSIRPTAVEDFLRATTKGYEFAIENQAQTIEWLQEYSEDAGLNFDPEGEAFRWATEAALVVQGAGTLPLGVMDLDAVQRQVDDLVTLGVIAEADAPNVARFYDNSFINAIYDNGTLVWPTN